MSLLEIVVEFVRDGIVEPNVGHKWVGRMDAAAPYAVPVHLHGQPDRRDPDLRRPRAAQLDAASTRRRIRSSREMLARRHHGDRQLQRHRGARDDLRSSPIIVAGTRAHGFVQHWKNLVPRRRAASASIRSSIPIEIMGMFVRPFALTMRLAGQHDRRPHRDARDPVVRLHLHAAVRTRRAGIGVGMVLSLPLGVGISALEHHRHSGAGVRVHAAHGRVHRHGHSRSSLSIRHGGETNGISHLRTWAPASDLGLTVIGAGIGIGRLAAAIAEGVGPAAERDARRSPARRTCRCSCSKASRFSRKCSVC